MQQSLKDPYVFEFLTLAPQAVERDIENQLVAQITRFLLELGKGFAFLGRQVPLAVNGRDYFLDLLFYHARLKCYVVIELKTGEFKPEYVGKLNFYLSAVDDQLRNEGDQPSIGLILCKSNDKLDVEYALRDFHKPMGVSSFITRDIPLAVRSQLENRPSFAPKKPPCGIVSKTCRSALTPALRRNRCKRTVLERNRSGLPETSSVRGNPRLECC